ncbi:MAG: T9SS type A sorting domain-containing protein, partial [Calditrichaeota bacterium]|nr:T9SS type A sorting domain-containing protein [Calditrichota bacterium]
MYAPARSDGVIIFDISDIMHPREVGRFEVENDAWYLDAEGDLLCVSDGNLNVFNIENRENPELLSVYDVPDSTRDIQIEYDYVYLNLGDRTYWHLPLLHIVDLNDPSNPVSVGHGETYYRPTNFFLNPPYIYTSDINGLGIYECSEVVGVSPDKEGFSPQTTMLYPAYPNPFNSFTSLQYHLTKPATVQIGIFDSQGRQVLDVANHQLKYPGMHTAIINANSLPSGSYYAFLKAGDLHEVAPLILVK